MCRHWFTASENFRSILGTQAIKYDQAGVKMVSTYFFFITAVHDDTCKTAKRNVAESQKWPKPHQQQNIF